MTETVRISGKGKKEIYPLGDNFSGRSPEGEEIGFTNYYMTLNGSPFFAVSGELHFSRMDQRRWEDEIIKMKMGGVNILSTYLFWIHHEEIEGRFDFTGCRDLRSFLMLCQKHRMYVIIRIGPFVHGESRNGGLPDWLYGKPFEVRTTSDGFMAYVKRFYQQIAGQISGLLYQEGGPVIATQLDNEYMHSSAPWESTTGVSNEWINTGSEGDAYILRLRDEAQACGICTPFYTCTAWGGAAVPDCTMPVWGGYAYRPWLFYKESGIHPATEEYLYQSFHDNSRAPTPDFAPRYRPEDRPYACCEMGGGMMCSYRYRFILPYKSVDAMANIKLASGCNFLGYYMYHGGTNPDGKGGICLNENQVCKKSYDFQAALGEFGQIRESYHRLRSIHYFCRDFQRELCGLGTVLPESASEITPSDFKILRFALRTDGVRGFLFINNFQDHASTRPKAFERIEIVGEDKTILFEDISLAPDENCILPFGFDMGGILLEWATAQPVARLSADGLETYVFLKPEGMQKVQFVFEKHARTDTGSERFICDNHKNAELFSVWSGSVKINVLCVDRALANEMYALDNRALIFADGAVLSDANGIRLQVTDAQNTVYTYPAGFLRQDKRTEGAGVLGCYRFEVPKKEILPKIRQVGPTRYTLSISPGQLDGLKDAILRIEYEGNMGQAFIDGRMISDHFYNGGPWEIGLQTFREALQENPITLYITPLKEDERIQLDSPAAPRAEQPDLSTGKLNRADILPVYEILL